MDSEPSSHIYSQIMIITTRVSNSCNYGKHAGSESVSMNDPVSGNMICDPEELKTASVKYLSNLLTNREPKEEYKRNLEIVKQLHEIRMSEELEVLKVPKLVLKG